MSTSSIQPLTETVVAIVDDDSAVLKGLSRLLRAAGRRVVTFSSPEDFLRQCDSSAIGCLVLDVSLPKLGGLELQNALHDRGDEVPIVFISGYGDVPMTVRAMKQGAVDFLTKPVDGVMLLDAIDRAIALGQSTREKRSEVSSLRARFVTLTPRESEVMQLVISGLLNKQIAVELGTSEKTIKVHRARVMEKTCANSLADLVRMAERAGIDATAPSEWQTHATV